MKKIYTFTLEDEEGLSQHDRNNLKLVAYLMYDQLINYEYRENKSILVRNKYIKQNELYERLVNGIYYYRFDSDLASDNEYLFEPFMIGEDSFGITVYDGIISGVEIENILDTVKKMIHFDKNIFIDSLNYNSSLDDEDNRIDTIKRIREKISYMYGNIKEEKIKKRRLINPMILIKSFGR